MSVITATAPASIGNFSVGFDLLGVAVAAIDGPPLADRVTLTPCEGPGHTFEVSGPYASWLPEGREDNIVWRCLEHFYEDIEEPMHVHLEKNLPVASGLGSSACSIVAAASAFNALREQPLDQTELLRLCAGLEAQISGDMHLDNIAPSLFGGAVLCNVGGLTELTHLDFPTQWRLVLAYSGQSVPTQSMREILPDSFAPELFSLQMRELARFSHALAEGDAETAAAAVVDHLAEPLRAPLLEGFIAAKEYCMANGALAVGISGSGPTLFAVCDDDDTAASLCKWLDQNYRVADHAFSRVCKVQTGGAQVNIET